MYNNHISISRQNHTSSMKRGKNIRMTRSLSNKAMKIPLAIWYVYLKKVMV